MNPDVGIPLLHSSLSYTQREVKLLKDLTQNLYLIHVNYTSTDEIRLNNLLEKNMNWK